LFDYGQFYNRIRPFPTPHLCSIFLNGHWRTSHLLRQATPRQAELVAPLLHPFTEGNNFRHDLTVIKAGLALTTLVLAFVVISQFSIF
jgi:hypothetical protein